MFFKICNACFSENESSDFWDTCLRKCDSSKISNNSADKDKEHKILLRMTFFLTEQNRSQYHTLFFFFRCHFYIINYSMIIFLGMQQSFSESLLEQFLFIAFFVRMLSKQVSPLIIKISRIFFLQANNK
jgi:hypothetical protein